MASSYWKGRLHDGWCAFSLDSSVDPSHKSHTALDKYPAMHNFVTEMYISVTKWWIVGCGTILIWWKFNFIVTPGMRDNSNSMKIQFHCNSFSGYDITTKHSTAALPWAKICSANALKFLQPCTKLLTCAIFCFVLFWLLTCAPRRSIVLQFFWSARKCL